MTYMEKGLRGIRPTTIPRCMSNAVTAQISMRFRLTGPNYVIISACTSSTNAIGTAFRMIRDGYAEQVLCGGAESLFDPATYGAWNNLGVMSRNPDPAKSCRPFDAARDGCVLGEGAAALMVESLDSARQRGARIRAELIGYGESSDAEHITSPSAEGQARAIRAALASAGIQPADIGFINAHGTATKANDTCESQSVRMALGDAADRIPVASNKSFFGHLLGAAGAIEALVTILGLESGNVPPNLNLDNPDPACNLNFVGNAAMAIASPIAMKNSFGFGGDNAVLVLRRWDR
jgi:3-oxoacyl-[acyl-carrier-protein] synthase II